MNDGQCFRIDLDEERRGAWHHMSRKVIDPRATQPVALISSEIFARGCAYSNVPVYFFILFFEMNNFRKIKKIVLWAREQIASRKGAPTKDTRVLGGGSDSPKRKLF